MKPSVLQLPRPHGWRARIDSHDRFSHDSIASLGYDWSRVADPHAEPQFPFAVYWPQTTEDVVRVVREASAVGERLIVRGNAHSSNRLSTGERARVVVTTRLTGLVDLDADAGVVTVRSGTVTADLDDYLGARGLGLPVMGSHNHITVGGFASVGGVGMTCHHHGLFADNVEAIEYVGWDGEVHFVTRAEDPVALQALLCGTGQHGIFTELTLRVVRIDKNGTLLELHQEAFRDYEGWIAALDPLMHEPTDVMLRGLWTDFQGPGGLRLRRGTVNRYGIVPSEMARRVRSTVGWGLLHGVGYFSGRMPGPIEFALRQVAIAGSIRPPRYAPYHHAEHLLDQVIDFSVGDASRWLISWAPLRTWRELALQQTTLLVDEREREGSLTFISLDIRPIRSGYLAQASGDDRFVEILYFVGLKPDRMTAAVEDNLVRRLDEACAAHDAYRYMHTLTVTEQPLRRQIDPNTYWATRAEDRPVTAKPLPEIRRGGRTLTQRVVPFTAGDGMRLHLVNVRGPAEPIRAPVLLAHGAGMQTESWLDAPIERTLVDALVADGYDVWLENWRGSIHAGPNPWTLDQAAVHDHPAAVRAIIDDTGADDVKAVVQCMGSTSFIMSALAGLLPQVSTIVANSVSLHVVVPPTARRKALYLGPIMRPAAPYLDPSWGEHPTTPLAHGMSLLVRATHRECKNQVCHMASFIYGAGRPTLWQHANLNGETHDWLSGQFGPAPREFFAQIARCIRAGHLVSVDGLAELPDDFVAQPPQTDARFVLLAGERNRCFLPVGQRRTFDFLDSHGRGRHVLHTIPGYGHLDVFIGRNAHRDTYPLILRGLEIGVG